MFKQKKKPEKEKDKEDIPLNEEESQTDADQDQLGDMAKDLQAIERDLQDLMGEEGVTDQEVENELARLERVILREKEQKEQQSKQVPNYSVKNKKVSDDIREILPLWLEKPIYWITPSDKFSTRKVQWTKEWAQFLLAYTDAKHLFVIIVRDVINEFPFKNPLIKKQLSRDQVLLIGDYLVDNNRADWLDRKKTRLLVLWQTRDETSEDLYLWAQQEGRQFVSIFELMEDSYWSSLPEEEIRKVFTILVNEKKAFYVNKRDKNAIQFEFKY